MVDIILAASEPSLWTFIIPGLTAIVVALIGAKSFQINRKAGRAAEQSKEVAEAVSTNNGKTIGQYTELAVTNLELLSDKVDLTLDKIENVEQQIDIAHGKLMNKMETHERDDTNRFSILEEKLNRLENPE